MRLLANDFFQKWKLSGIAGENTECSSVLRLIVVIITTAPLLRNNGEYRGIAMLRLSFGNAQNLLLFWNGCFLLPSSTIVTICSN